MGTEHVSNDGGREIYKMPLCETSGESSKNRFRSKRKAPMIPL